MNRFIIISLILIMPFVVISQDLKKTVYLKADFAQIFDHNKISDFSFDILNHIYIGKFVTENIAIGITTNDAVSSNDNNRYMLLYSLSDYQVFSVYYLKINNHKVKPFLSLKTPFKFKDETYYVYNSVGDLSIEEQSFNLLDQASIGAGVSFELKTNVFFDFSYTQLLRKNIYGFKNGFCSFGVHFELDN